jgi:hypothetical protein
MISTNLDSAKYTPRTLEVKLPSRGVLYGPSFPSSVVVGAFGWSTHAHLNTNQEGGKKMLSIIDSGIIKNFPSEFNVKNMLMADALLIFAVARALTFSETYKFSTTCPACGFNMVGEIKVPDNLPVRVWEYNSAEEVEKACNVTLTGCKDRIGYGFSTFATDLGRNSLLVGLKAAIKDAPDSKQLKQFDDGGLIYMINSATQIRSINGDKIDTMSLEGVIAVSKYLMALDGPDVELLKDAMSENEPGIRTQVPMQCDDCSHVYQSALPLASDFFRRNQV